MSKTWFLKVALVGLAGLATLMLFTSGKRSDIERIEFSPTEDARELSGENLPDAVGQTTMVSPRYTGEDENGRTWDISAESATHTEDNDHTDIALTLINAALSLQTGGAIIVNAGSGHFNPINQNISLSGRVNVKGYGYTLSTEGLIGNIKTREVRTTGPLELKGIGIMFKAKNFETTNQGKDLTLNNINISINPKIWNLKNGAFMQ